MSHYVYKRLAIDDVVPGMILGKMLITQDGKNFLNEGAVLTLRVVQTLQLWGFRYVDIREEVAGEAPGKAGALETDLNVETELSGEIIKEKSKVPAGFQAYYEAAVQIFKMNLGRARFVKDGFEVADIRQMVSECILPLIEDAAVMDHLQMVSHTEDYLYHHSIDVGILSGCIGMWRGRPFREIEEIILGAMLHDVGKTLIPLKVLNKTDVLTDEERNLVRFHSIRGYKFLKQNTELPRSVLLCALQHHERVDGSGYPLSVQGDKIHPYAKIIAVADVFDAMTSDRNYGRKATPYEAVEVLRSEMARKLDCQVCSVFIDKLCQRFVGDVVELSDGRRGEVVFLNQFDSTRPMVNTTEGSFVDLDKSRDLSICKMLHS